jgi:LuxR family maltose regulon positive regulatory protein
VGGAITLADIRLAQGRLREAMAHYDLGLAQATREGAAFEPSAADMHIGMSTLFLERNDLGAAKEHLLAGSVLADPTAFSQHAHRRPVAEAAILAAEGDLRGALLHLDDAAGVHADDFSPNVRPIAASQARVHLALGDTDEARRWADQQRLTPDDELSYLHEFEHLTLARILLAETAGSGAGLDVVSRFLERLLAAAEAGGRRGSEIEVLILQAIALQRRHQVATAIDTIERAMVSAEPEGYVRIFLDEGAALAPLLRAAAQRGGAASPASRLLAAAAAPIAAVTGRGPLVDALSERELDVLRLLRSDLNGPEIARELMVSLNTVRTHTKSIYSKLAVNNRRSAIRRADELRL